MASADYNEKEWTTSAGHYPLMDTPTEDLLLLHRHWMWANQQREVFDRYLQAVSDDFSLEKDRLYLKDEQDREHETKVVKKILKTEASQ